MPFAPNGLRGHPSGRGDRLLRLHRLRRDLDRRGGDEESAAQPADRHPRRAGDLHVIYVIVGVVATGLVPYQQLQRGRSAGAGARGRRAARRAGWIVALGAVVSMTAVLLVFQYGQPRIFFAMARDGLLPQWAAKIQPKHRMPHITTVVTGIVVALGALVAGRERDLRPHQHRHAVRVRARLHRRARAARTRTPTGRGRSGCRSSGRSALLGAAACVYMMFGLPRTPGSGSASGWSSGWPSTSSTASATAGCTAPGEAVDG